MKELIDKYGRDWRVLTGAGLATAGLAAATIFLGLYKSIAALFVAGALALAAVVIAVFRWLAKRARGRTALELEKGILGLPTPALADGRTSVPELTRKFREALDKLRNAPELGHDYLYRVPW